MVLGVFVGRFCPFHTGHYNLICNMINYTQIQLIIIGSSNSQRTPRVPFTYSERKSFIKKCFPNINVIGVPDYWHLSDDMWIEAIDDIIDLMCMQNLKIGNGT